jgi:SAM-dependent methyltransferase
MNSHLFPILRCPACHAPLRQRPGALECEKHEEHVFSCSGSYIVFSSVDPGKYDAAYAERYAFLWAYGYETRNSGLVESLYRGVGALAAEAIAEMRVSNPVVVDCGCGVGRVIADAAIFAPSAQFLGVDLSPAKLNLASEILLGTKPVERSLPEFGFTNQLAIRSRNLTNVLLAQANALSLPIESASADLVLSVNLLDRVENPKSVIQEQRRVLRPGGTLILTTPLNWTNARLWMEYPGATSLVAVVEQCGFNVRTWFDQLLYREILDARGSVEEFTTLVVSAQAI